MPFATKFRAMMAFPFAGDTLGDYLVESVSVRDVSEEAGLHVYAVQMVLRGRGGQQGARQALKPLFAAHPTTFSGYGNPYQLWFAKPAIESLGEGRYEVMVAGGGARVFLAEELQRLLGYLVAQGHLAVPRDAAAHEALVAAYLEQYRQEIKRKVDRYRSRLAKAADMDPLPSGADERGSLP
jgi:CubicO group peptidase (beta-lactamase class C family)